MKITAVTIADTDHILNLSIPFYCHTQGYKPIKRRNNADPDRLAYITDRYNSAIARALTLYPSTTHLLIVDSYYLGFTDQISQLVSDYKTVGTILGASVWMEAKSYLWRNIAYYDTMSVRELKGRKWHSRSDLPRGIRFISGVGACWIFPRNIWEESGGFKWKPGINGGNGEMVTSRCLKHNLPVMMDFNVRLWRTGETNPAIRNHPMTYRLARSTLALCKTMTGIDFESRVKTYRRRKRYEPEVMREMTRVHGDLFVDIGANMGLYSRELARNFVRVYAFEPNPNNSLDNLPGNVSVFRKALSNEEGERSLFISDIGGGGADTLLPVFDYKPAVKTGTRSQTFIGRQSHSFPVSVSRYDSVVRERADLVKIDVEGAELLVLEGMEESLKRGDVWNLMVELHNIDNEENLLEILTRHYRKVKKVDDHPRFFASAPRTGPMAP